jgi:hypothetical protein
MSQEEQANQQSDVLGSGAEGGATPSSSRRRFIAGVASGSILMTVASRPALAGGGKGDKGGWCTPSAWVSGNLSQTNSMRNCGGRSPGYWKSNFNRWPSTVKPGSCKTKGNGNCTDYKGDGTPFHKSNGGPFAGDFFGSLTMMQVLWLTGNKDPYQLGSHIIAAYLNAVTIPNYGMTPSMVVDMWDQLTIHGFYQPTPGAPSMSKEEVVVFIKNTFGE